jgi:hypothetical protein
MDPSRPARRPPATARDSDTTIRVAIAAAAPAANQQPHPAGRARHPRHARRTPHARRTQTPFSASRIWPVQSPRAACAMITGRPSTGSRAVPHQTCPGHPPVPCGDGMAVEGDTAPPAPPSDPAVPSPPGHDGPASARLGTDSDHPGREGERSNRSRSSCAAHPPPPAHPSAAAKGDAAPAPVSRPPRPPRSQESLPPRSSNRPRSHTPTTPAPLISFDLLIARQSRRPTLHTCNLRTAAHVPMAHSHTMPSHDVLNSRSPCNTSPQTAFSCQAAWRHARPSPRPTHAHCDQPTRSEPCPTMPVLQLARTTPLCPTRFRSHRHDAAPTAHTLTEPPDDPLKRNLPDTARHRTEPVSRPPSSFRSHPPVATFHILPVAQGALVN